MRIRNTQPNMNFKAAIIVDFKDSGHPCPCDMGYDAMKATVGKGLIDKKGLIDYEVPFTSPKKIILVNGPEKDELSPFAQTARYSEVADKIDSMAKEKGIPTLKYTDILEKSSEELKAAIEKAKVAIENKAAVETAKVTPKKSLAKTLLKKIFK